MKHILTTVLFALLLVPTVASQDCTISISFDPKLRNSRKYSRTYREGVVMSRFKNFFELRGITTEVHNARLAVCFVPIVSQQSCSDGNLRMDFDIQLVDYYTQNVLHSWTLDTFLCGEKTTRCYSYYVNHKVYRFYRTIVEWFFSDADTLRPIFNWLADDVRKSAVSLFEVNTHNITRVAQDCAREDEHEAAFFVLAQYPTCCPSYSNVRDCMAAVYRDYMKKDHKALLYEAKRVWNSSSTDADARFIVALLNSEPLTDYEQWKADRLLRKVAKAFPNIDIKAKEDYTFVPELKDILVSRACALGINYSYYTRLPDTENFITEME